MKTSFCVTETFPKSEQIYSATHTKLGRMVWLSGSSIRYPLFS